jgi:ABC-2 type transport system permease protein
MLRSVFAKGMRDQRNALIAWTIAVVAYALLIVAFYPTIKASMASVQDMADKMPKVLRDAFIGSDMASPTGWIDTKFFSLMAPILFLVYAIGAGARSIAGEEEEHTLDLLLAQPVSRGRVLLEKYGDVVVGLLVLTAALFVTLVATAPLFSMDVAVGKLLQGSLLVGLLGLAFGSVAFLVAGATVRRALAYGVAGGLAGAMYLVNILAPDVAGLHWLRPLSLFSYYGIAPVAEGLRGEDVAVFAGVSLACLAAAYLIFGRRDIA